MKEKFLHYVWKYKLLDFNRLKTIDGERIYIVNTGQENTNTGPDFFNAKIEIEGQLWFGNVEIHIKSSDWYLHKHEKDENYDAVILHVVFENDATIFMKNNKPLPTLELKNFIDKNVYDNYIALFFTENKWILCEQQLSKTDDFLMQNWLERLFFERLERKAAVIKELLEKTNNDFEAVLFQLLAKNFGLKINGDAFLQLASSVDYSIVRKLQKNELQLNALLYGQAGFLNEDLEGTFYNELQKEYEYVKHKHSLKGGMAKHQFQFFRMRPSNFPTIRIAQLSALYYKQHHLFSKIMSADSVSDLYVLFDVEITDFWKTHYTFEKESKKSIKKLTKSFKDLLIINTILPLKFVYLKSIGKLEEEVFISLLEQINPEKNSIITKFNEIGVKTESAFKTQALLELKNSYCNNKDCLKCAIGNRLLRK
ncbi:DUF2851 family protein [Tenacibaculum sp. M341]|uniref:DUF2851 family protein n=1 Tax=Tenacibaculum sp. M341 TaxID=2530339 RepID=UPI0010435035|nr:DUF2851 family protein [Tenacibaculum sp. M341]TCI91823.1 DUF2851 family protein [Tenacibaculum sp. M341]